METPYTHYRLYKDFGTVTTSSPLGRDKKAAVTHFERVRTQYKANPDDCLRIKLEAIHNPGDWTKSTTKILKWSKF